MKSKDSINLQKRMINHSFFVIIYLGDNMDNLSITVPIIEDENIGYILDSCLKNNGLNKKHSRSIKPLKYKAPVNGDLTREQENKLKISLAIEILKYYFNNCIKELKRNNCDMNETISKIIPTFSLANITGNDLLKIINSSEEEILSIINKDKTTQTKLEFLITRFIGIDGIENEHFNSSPLYFDSSKETEEKLLNGYSKRIYLNLPRHSIITYKLGLTFIERCIDKNIPFDLKLIGSFIHDESDLDGTIIYSKNAYFEEHIKIIQEILRDYKEYKEYIGTPITTGGNIIDEEDNKAYMAISHSGKGNRYGITYNDTADCIINSTYTYSCCRIIKAYFPYFANKMDREILSDINLILNGEITIDKVDKLREIEDKIRKLVYDFYNYKKDNNETIEFRIIDYIKEDISSFSSIINFGDLNHKNNPMYEDNNFLLLDKSNKIY